jgi:predicted membrane protein
MTLLARVVDERFLMHRLRSTSAAGIIGGVVAICLFAYRFYFNHRWSWDLMAVSLTIVGVKLAFMAWYHLTD